MASDKNSNIYEEVEIEDMLFDEELLVYTYPCPCGDQFRILLEELHDAEDIAKCPSCTLRIKVIYEESDLPALPDFDDDDNEEDGVHCNDDIAEHMKSISVQGTDCILFAGIPSDCTSQLHCSS